jgi:hypothetical protein
MKRSVLFYLYTLLFAILQTPVFAQDPNSSSVKKIIFEEKHIEGKIRRPQLVLIKADQRPEFDPMVLQSMGTGSNVLQTINKDLINDSPYKGAFQFKDMEITNYVP